VEGWSLSFEKEGFGAAKSKMFVFYVNDVTSSRRTGRFDIHSWVLEYAI
jgi:hypothetical protein